MSEHPEGSTCPRCADVASAVDDELRDSHPVIRCGIDHYLHVALGTMRGQGEREPLVEELDRAGCDLEHVTIFDAIEASWMMLGHA